MSFKDMEHDNEKGEKGVNPISATPVANPALRDITSPGVQRIEAISSAITTWDRVSLFLSILLVAYVYGLDGTLRYVYQPEAANSFANHSLQSTIATVRAGIAAAAQPTAGKIADVFGRVELVLVSIVLYTVGTIIEASSSNIATFIGGAVIYQVGYTVIILLLEVIIADITSTRSRVLFSYIPALPFLINTWVSGYVSSAVLSATTWHWGVGMWAIIYPVSTLPLIINLVVIARRAKKEGRLDNCASPLRKLGLRALTTELFWVLDVIGVILVIAIFALILVPLTLAGGIKSTWGQAHIIAPLVIGAVCIPIFIVWELKAPHPLVPFALMKDRGIWAPLGIAVFLNFAWTMQGDYLYSLLLVAFDFETRLATQVTSFYSFFSVVSGVVIGFIVYKIRRLKVIMIAGTCLFMVAFGILIRYRGSPSGRAGLIGGQVLLGIAGGMFPYPAQASLQSQVKHEHLAVLTGIYLALYNVGSALGNSISGAIWTQTLAGFLENELKDINSTLAVEAFKSPLTVIGEWPVGTPERTAIIESYQHVQRLLTITGICLCIPLIGFALLTRNTKLNDKQTLAKDNDSASEDRVSV